MVKLRRVSTESQGDSGLGLDAQDVALDRGIELRGWETVASFADVASGKKNARRPGFDAALALLAAGGADVLMAAKLDRLTRNLTDLCLLAERAEREGWSIVVLDPPLDTTTPMGAGTLKLFAVIAEIERTMIRERTTAALAAKRARGERLGRPSGVPAEVQAFVVACRERGESLRTIAGRLNREGVPTSTGAGPWGDSSVRQVLRSWKLDGELAAARAKVSA